MRDFLLDPWHVQPSLNLLVREDEARQIGPKVMGILVCLANRAEQAVTKEEILEQVWEGIFTTDEALTTAIYELRKALDDDARSPRFVATVRGRGYRLIGDVKWLPIAQSELPLEHSTTQHLTSMPQNPAPQVSTSSEADTKLETATEVLATKPQRYTVSLRRLGIAAVVATSALALTFGLMRPSSTDSNSVTTPTSSPAQSSPTQASSEDTAVLGPDIAAQPYSSGPRPICSVVVLPLESLTSDSHSAIFAQGLSEQLAHDLAQGGTLAVVPGYSSVMDGRSSSDLSTDAVVEGSVQPSGERLWIRMQMVDTLDGRLLWGGTYDHQIGDSLDLQHELSREITRQILLHVEPVAGCANRGFGTKTE